jgi:hypothetical protein
VIWVEDPSPWILHIELQTSYDRLLVRRVLKYNVLLSDRHDVPVMSVAVLLRPETDGRELSGTFERQLPDVGAYLRLRYRVVRVWQQPAERLVEGGFGTLPLAPLSAVAPEELPGLVRRMQDRIREEVRSPDAAKLWLATYVLMGLRYPADLVSQLLQRVRDMEESATYQAIIAKGQAAGMREILLRQGTERFGRPGAEVRSAIDAVSDVEQLERLGVRLLHVSSWDELLAPAHPRRRNGKRRKTS